MIQGCWWLFPDNF